MILTRRFIKYLKLGFFIDKMRLAIDLDGVLVDIVTGIVNHHNEIKQTNFTLTDFRRYHLHETFKITEQERDRMLELFYATHHFQNLLPIPGSVDGLRKLSKKHKLFLITARAKNLEHVTLDWVNKHFPKLFSKIVFTPWHDKTHEKKAEVCKELEIDVFIEDSLENASACKEYCKIIEERIKNL